MLSITYIMALLRSLKLTYETHELLGVFISRLKKRLATEPKWTFVIAVISRRKDQN